MKDNRRWRVEFKYGSYLSLAYDEKDKAFEVYRTQGGERILLCDSLFDDAGTLVEGKFSVEDRTAPFYPQETNDNSLN